MKGYVALLLAPVVLLYPAVVWGGASGPQVRSQVYTVTQVQARLAEDPRAWADRQVRVRATAGGCIPWAAPKGSPCIDEQPALLEMGSTGMMAALPLVCGPRPLLFGFVPHLTWLGSLQPTLQTLPNATGIYRIRLPAVPGSEARLLDSLPSCGEG
jgi:hypothetical protein